LISDSNLLFIQTSEKVLLIRRKKLKNSKNYILFSLIIFLISFTQGVTQDDMQSRVLKILGSGEMAPGESKDFTEFFFESLYDVNSLSLIGVEGADANYIDVTLNSWSQLTSMITVEITISLDPSAPPGSELSFTIVYRYYFIGGYATVTSAWTIKVITKTVEPEISVLPDTLCFGIPNDKINMMKNLYAIGENSINNFYQKKSYQLPKGKRMMNRLQPLTKEQLLHSNLQFTISNGNLDTLIYDDGNTEDFYSWGEGIRMASRMSPAGSCKILAIQIYCLDKQNYKVGVYNWTGNSPGNELLETGVVVSSGQGWNTTDISAYNINVNGEFIASFNMIDTTAAVGFDPINNGRAWDYYDLSWHSWNETYFIRAIIEYEDGIVDTVATMTIQNLGNTDLSVNDITKGQEWITSIEPQTFSVAPYGSKHVTVTVRTSGLSNGTHYGSLNIYSNDPDENPYMEPVKFIVTIVGIEEDIKYLDIPNAYYLSQNYPNPFNPSTKISFTLPKPEHVTFAVYNTLGQKVATLLNRKINAGSHDVQFEASTLPSGIYFYRMQAGEFSQVRKMVLLR
jgi:hypothetical protein